MPVVTRLFEGLSVFYAFVLSTSDSTKTYIFFNILSQTQLMSAACATKLNASPKSTKLNVFSLSYFYQSSIICKWSVVELPLQKSLLRSWYKSATFVGVFVFIFAMSLRSLLQGFDKIGLLIC